MDCDKHPGRPFELLCSTCQNVPVCVTCIAELHNGHKFKTAQDVVVQVTLSLKDMMDKDRILLDELNTGIAHATQMKKLHEDESMITKQKIDEQRQLFHTKIDEIADHRLSEFDQLTKDGCGVFDNAHAAISKTIEKVTQHEKTVKCIAAKTDDMVKVCEWRNLEAISEDLTCLTYSKPDTKEFFPGMIDQQLLWRMLGGTADEVKELTSMQAAQVVAAFEGIIKQEKLLFLTSDFKHPTPSYVHEMAASTNGQTWLGTKDDYPIQLSNNTGEIEKTVNCMINGMVVISANKLLVCCSAKKEVKKVNLPAGDITTFFTTGKLHPSYICKTTNGDLYVTLTDMDDYTITPESKRLLVKFTASGKERARAQYDEFGEAIFVKPLKVKVSSTGDRIAVTNATDKDNIHLVILDIELALHLRYLGHGKVVLGSEKLDNYRPEKQFAIHGIEFDPCDNIMICEGYTRSIILLSPEAEVIQTLLPTQEQVPRSLSLNKDDMWVGYENGTVRIYKYKW